MENDTSGATAGVAPRNLWRSSFAVIAGMLTVIVLSLGTDEMLQVAGVYPAQGHGMPEPGLNLLALSYRCVYNVVGAYITAMLAPRNLPRHVTIFALIGFALGTLGAIVTIPMHLGPAWYPILLALSALPCSWLGLLIFRARR